MLISVCVSVSLFDDFGLCVSMATEQHLWGQLWYDAVYGWKYWICGWMRTLSACFRAWGALVVAWAFRKCSHALSVTVSPSLSFTWPGTISGSNRWVWRSRDTLSQSWVSLFPELQRFTLLSHLQAGKIQQSLRNPAYKIVTLWGYTTASPFDILLNIFPYFCWLFWLNSTV